MKTYQCHKRVQAMKIAAIETAQGQLPEGVSFSDLRLCGTDGTMVYVKEQWMRRHTPEIGGYFVRYDDGYESYSPAAAFEGGYTEVPA